MQSRSEPNTPVFGQRSTLATGTGKLSWESKALWMVEAVTNHCYFSFRFLNLH